MKRLKDKNIYYFVTGAKKAALAPEIIKELTNEGANVYVIPTASSKQFLDEKDLVGAKQVKGNWGEGEKLPQEDAVLIAPCTFNTLNAVAIGRADTYPLCLIAASIGRNVPVFIAPAMEKALWEHPIIPKNLKVLESWGCSVIWPELSRSKATMIEIGKILDTVIFNFSRVNYQDVKVDKPSGLPPELRTKVHKDFLEIGRYLGQNGLNSATAGCISIKTKDGIIVTTSGADLAELRPENLSLITEWDERDNSITWHGDLCPSSETPLHCLVNGSENDLGQIVLHFHDPRFTYNDKLKQYQTKKYVRYGSFDLAHSVKQIIDEKGICIMKYHGIVVKGQSVEEIYRKIKRLEKSI